MNKIDIIISSAIFILVAFSLFLMSFFIWSWEESFNELLLELAKNLGFPIMATFVVGLVLLYIGNEMNKVRNSIDHNTALHYYNYGEYLNALLAWEKLAKKGDVDAQFSIGTMYAEGKAVLQNDEKAFEWLSKASKNGNINAQYNLSIMYYNGKGVSKDFVKAYMWTSIAIANGINIDAVEVWLKMIEKEMSDEDIEKAQELAKQCIKSKYKKCG